ncbi:MAG: hypothetical protein ACO1O6_14940 [Bacteroidota bacterium]
MKILFTCFIFLPFLLLAQPRENSAQVSARYGIGKVDSALYQNTSLGLEVMLGKKWGLNYNFDFIFRNDRIFQIHSTPGFISWPVFVQLFFHPEIASELAGNSNSLLLSNINFLLLFGGIIDTAIPEGVSYHIPLRSNWDIAPYVNALSMDYVRNRNTDKTYLRYSFNFGARLTYWNKNNLTMGAFLETRKVFGMGWAPGGGISFGYSFLY